MCVVDIIIQIEEEETKAYKYCHSFALEIRPAKTYIYNSFQDIFSNAWFSGIPNTSGSDFLDKNVRPEEKEVFREYKN